MSLDRVIVGYRPDERGAHYPDAREVGPCISCGSPVFLVPSGQDAYRDRDPQLVCTYCKARYEREIMEEL